MWRNLCKLIDKNKKSVYQVSKETGIAESQIWAWIKQKHRPNADNLINLAEYFGVSVDDLLRETL